MSVWGVSIHEIAPGIIEERSYRGFMVSGFRKTHENPNVFGDLGEAMNELKRSYGSDEEEMRCALMAGVKEVVILIDSVGRDGLMRPPFLRVEQLVALRPTALGHALLSGFAFLEFGGGLFRNKLNRIADFEGTIEERGDITKLGIDTNRAPVYVGVEVKGKNGLGILLKVS
jgi:hypothetical protein